MFIREKTKTSKGKEYTQHQLIESLRTPVGPRQKLVLNLGFLNLPKDKWKDLANTIESILHNRPELFAPEPEIEKLAKHYTRLIQARKLNDIVEKQKERTPKQKTADYEVVDLNSVCTSDAETIGAEHVVVSQLEEYKFHQILQTLGFDHKQIIYAKMLVAGRLIHPASERETSRWINQNSSISELLQTDIKVYDNALHRTAAKLWEHHDFIEKSLSENARDIFNLKETVILYDLTNTYFQGSKKFSKIAKHGGKSKEKRNDKPLVTLALTVDEEGFPKQSRILEGNVSEPGTLETMLDELDNNTPLFNTEKTIVIDAGIASEENLELIKKKKFKYVAVSRKQSYPDDLWDRSNAKELKLSDGKTTLKLSVARTEDEVYVLCHSEAKEAKEKAIFERRLRKFEEGLSQIHEGLTKKKTEKKYEKIIERIGRLKAKYKVGNLYKIEITSNNGQAVKINFAKNKTGEAKESRYGEYVLRSNNMDLSDEDISKTHRSLTTVEASFRCMKSELGLRPNYHKTDVPSTAHIFITVIAYHIIAATLKKTRTSGLNYSWETMRNILSSHIRVTTALNAQNGDTINIRTSTTPTSMQQEIYNKLNIKQKPLKQVKVRIPLKKNKMPNENVVPKKS